MPEISQMIMTAWQLATGDWQLATANDNSLPLASNSDLILRLPSPVASCLLPVATPLG
jgi:hypothetical protein